MYPQQTLPTNIDERIEELTKMRDLFEHKMHMVDWDILMLKRYELIKQYEDADHVESN